MKNHGIAVAIFIFTLILASGAARAAAQGQEAKGQEGGEQDASYKKELEIRDLLLEKGGESALGIRVTVDRTKAILTGEVPGRPAQELAEEVALSVDLRGTLPDANRKQLALDTAGKTKGVKKVIDLIKVKS